MMCASRARRRGTHGHSRVRSPGRRHARAYMHASTHKPGPDSFRQRVRLGGAEERPILSASAQSAASGNTIFFDAQSCPGSSIGTRSMQGSGSAPPVPSVPPMPQAHLPQPSPLSQEIHQTSVVGGSPDSAYSASSTELAPPPTYATTNAGWTGSYSDIDVLDMPTPRPASPFSATSGSRMSPPSLLPNPAAWRNSHVGSSTSPPTDSASSVNIDVLEDAPPLADRGWQMLVGGS